MSPAVRCAESPSPQPCVVGVGPFPRYRELLARLGIEQTAVGPEDAFQLVERGGRLELRPPDEVDRPGIAARFPPDKHSAPSAGARGPLTKAFGKHVHSVLDATLGLGADAYRLAEAGYSVEAWERDPTVFALCASAWEAARADGAIPEGVASRLMLAWGESRSALRDFAGTDRGLYFDPMYPAPKKASSLPKRPLQILRRLLGDASDEERAAALVESARPLFSRVVVKRPHHAPPLATGAAFEVETKLVRFDVYLNPERMESRDR